MSSLALALLLRESAVPAVVSNVPGDPEFAGMVKARRRELHAITERLIAGDIDPVAWADAMQGVLLEGHTRSAYFGRLIAIGKEDKSELMDLLAGQAASDSESFYLRGFLDAILDKDPRYWDDEAEAWRGSAIKARQDMYLSKMRGTANGVFLSESIGFMFDWVLGGAEDHCEECPEYASMSPWEATELPTHPGDNDTPCKHNCTCFLRREDDVTGFKPVEL